MYYVQSAPAIELINNFHFISTVNSHCSILREHASVHIAAVLWLGFPGLHWCFTNKLNTYIINIYTSSYVASSGQHDVGL